MQAPLLAFLSPSKSIWPAFYTILSLIRCPHTIFRTFGSVSSLSLSHSFRRVEAAKPAKFASWEHARIYSGSHWQPSPDVFCSKPIWLCHWAVPPSVGIPCFVRSDPKLPLILYAPVPATMSLRRRMSPDVLSQGNIYIQLPAPCQIT